MEDSNVATEANYVVVGGGAVGCVVAGRLSADPRASVVLLEAGGRVPPALHEAVSTPMRAFELVGSELAAQVPTVPQRHANGRVVPLATGRVLGGGSSINAMGWFPGLPEDFDRWASQGAEGWSWEDVRPWVQAVENHELGAGEMHGGDGPMSVTSPRHLHPLAMSFVRAGVEMGWPVSHDLNGMQRSGVSLAYSNVRDGRRWSVVDAYLDPVCGRENLSLVTGARVESLMLDGNRATGVVYNGGAGTPRRELAARRGVVVSAGAIWTPQLLMCSGIGPADHLREMGVTVAVDLAGVGQNLQDHPAVVLSWALRDTEDADYASAEEFYDLQLRGPWSTLGQGIAALAADGRVRDPSAPPDIHLGVLPVAPGPDRAPQQAACQVALVNPESRGRVRLTSSDPAGPVAVDPNYLAAPHDRERLREGIRMGLDLFGTGALQAVVGECLTPVARDDQSLDAVIDEGLFTYYHPVGTARIGTDADGVVDARLAVHGTRNLWVADASVMPTIVRANTQATTIVIAERAAASIARCA